MNRPFSAGVEAQFTPPASCRLTGTLRTNLNIVGTPVLRKSPEIEIV
jgi:hypothetical protein